MENISFYKKVLMSKDDYWIVAKKNMASEYGSVVRRKDQIIFITIPTGIKRGLNYEEITLQELEKLHRSYCDQNIFMNINYPPFQQGVSFCNIYFGFPVTCDIKKFVIDALALSSDDIFKYKELISLPLVDINKGE